MTSTVSFQKRIAKAFSDDSSIAFDLVSHLTYLSALSTARPSRNVIMERAASLPFRTREYFQRVLALVKRLGFEYSRAFQLVAAVTQIEAMKGILSRFAGSIISGGNEALFLQQETVVAMERYVSDYDRAVEALKKWTDAFAALQVSATLIIVVGLISTLMYAINQVFIAAVGASMVGFVLLGVYIIGRSGPSEDKTYDTKGGPTIRRIARALFFTCAPAGLGLAFLMYRRGGLGAALLILGLAVFPPGLCGYIDDRRVNKIDQDLPNLLRTLGALTSSLGSTLTAALDKIDRKALGALEKPMRRLHGRLLFRLEDTVCWNKLFEETGSQLAYRTGRALVDAIRLGGPAERVGEICSGFALQNVLLRSKRYTVAETFTYLSLPLHAAMVSLLLFVLQILVNFNNKITELLSGVSDGLSKASSSLGMGGLPMFEVHDLHSSILLTYALILALTVANALGPHVAGGGHWLKSFFYLSITMVMSGICILVVPPAAAALFHI